MTTFVGDLTETQWIIIEHTWIWFETIIRFWYSNWCSIKLSPDWEQNKVQQQQIIRVFPIYIFTDNVIQYPYTQIIQLAYINIHYFLLKTVTKVTHLDGISRKIEEIFMINNIYLCKFKEELFLQLMKIHSRISVKNFSQKYIFHRNTYN